MVCWVPTPTSAPTRPPSTAATTAVTTTTQSQFRRVRVWRTTGRGGGGAR